MLSTEKMLKYSHKAHFCILKIFIIIIIKTKPSFLNFEIYNWEKSLSPASLWSRTGVCLHKPDTPTPETTLVFVAEFVSFFPCSKLFINPLLLCYIFSQLLACCINTICLLLFYLHHYLFFLKVPFTPHPVPQFLCCSHYQASYLLTPCSWPLPQLSSLLVSHSSLSFSVCPLAGLSQLSPHPDILPWAKKYIQKQ